MKLTAIEKELLAAAIYDKMEQYAKFEKQAFNAGMEDWIKKWSAKKTILGNLLLKLDELFESEEV